MQLDISSLSADKALKAVGVLIDQATDLNSLDMAQYSLKLCDELAFRLRGASEVKLHYFKANAWSVIRHVKHQDESYIWLWDQEEILNEIYNLRSAIRHDSFNSLGSLRQGQILVNTGNILHHIGRPIEAIEYWKRALDVIPNFGMAMGNLGAGYEHYAKQLYDKEHSTLIFKEAYNLLNATNKKPIVWDHLDFKKTQKKMLDQALLISKYIDFSSIKKKKVSYFPSSLTKKEKNYKTWALKESLFLNPLNDINNDPITAQDTLHLPDMNTDNDIPISLIGFFNQLKQEFVSARYILWEGITSIESSERLLADNDLLLIDTLDYSLYGLPVEQIKLAFRIAFSLFDKIAFFINYYWKLEIPLERVNFHSVWLKNRKQLRSLFAKHPNLSLRGLYWLSKEFSDKNKDEEIALGEVMEPDAEKLRTIRNHLEHRYLKVHDDVWDCIRENKNSLFYDKLAYHLTSTEMIEKTLRLLKRAREALIYLSLAVHQEERIKAENTKNTVMPISLPTWE